MGLRQQSQQHDTTSSVSKPPVDRSNATSRGSNLNRPCTNAPECGNKVSIHAMHNRCRLCLGINYDPTHCTQCRSLKKTQYYNWVAFYKNWGNTGHPVDVIPAASQSGEVSAVQSSLPPLQIQTQSNFGLLNVVSDPRPKSLKRCRVPSESEDFEDVDVQQQQDIWF